MSKLKYDKEDDDRFFDEFNWADASILVGAVIFGLLLIKSLI